MPELTGLKAQVETASIRTQTYKGAEYTVIPVVAMIEGVRFGANQSGAELGLVAEFGKFLDSWNNRPCTVGHPKNSSGDFISANGLATLESTSFGITANAKLEDTKLHLEAWISNSEAEANSEAQDILDRIQSGDITEVSVGFFCDVEQSAGKFKGQSYTGVWRSIVPDHLAFLEEGTVGACSVEDGCGAPRINMQLAAEQSAPTTTEITIPQQPTPQILQPTIEAAADTIRESVMRAFGYGKKDDDKKKKKKTMTSEPTIDESIDCGCGCGGKCGQPSIQERKGYTSQDHTNRVLSHALGVQQLSSQLLTRDVMKALTKALLDEYSVPAYDLYVMGYTSEVVVYEIWESGNGYCEYMYPFDINDNAEVTFTGEPTKVSIVSRIVAKQPTTQEKDMPDAIKVKQDGKIVDPASLSQEQRDQLGEEVVSILTGAFELQETPATKDSKTPKVNTVQEYIESAPEGMREVLAQSHRMHEMHKKVLIDRILEAGKEGEETLFTEEYLKGQSIEVLEKMAKLAKVEVPEVQSSYSGVAVPTQPQNPNTQEEYAPLPGNDRWNSQGSAVITSINANASAKAA